MVSFIADSEVELDASGGTRLAQRETALVGLDLAPAHGDCFWIAAADPFRPHLHCFAASIRCSGIGELGNCQDETVPAPPCAPSLGSAALK